MQSNTPCGHLHVHNKITTTTKIINKMKSRLEKSEKNSISFVPCFVCYRQYIKSLICFIFFSFSSSNWMSFLFLSSHLFYMKKKWHVRCTYGLHVRLYVYGAKVTAFQIFSIHRNTQFRLFDLVLVRELLYIYYR